jgi:hypothetical protein
MRCSIRPLAIASIAGALAGCASAPFNVAPMPAAGYERLQQASGTACGALGILATGYYFIPMGLNSRVERAWAAALESVPGATSLVDVQMHEDWHWIFVATNRCTTITGTAIREVKR